MTQELDHLLQCPNWVRSSDPTLCICEKFDEIRGLELIKEHLKELFENTPEPELFDWAEVVEEFDEKY